MPNDAEGGDFVSPAESGYNMPPTNASPLSSVGLIMGSGAMMNSRRRFPGLAVAASFGWSGRPAPGSSPASPTGGRSVQYDTSFSCAEATGETADRIPATTAAVTARPIAQMRFVADDCSLVSRGAQFEDETAQWTIGAGKVYPNSAARRSRARPLTRSDLCTACIHAGTEWARQYLKTSPIDDRV